MEYESVYRTSDTDLYDDLSPRQTEALALLSAAQRLEDSAASLESSTGNAHISDSLDFNYRLWTLLANSGAAGDTAIFESIGALFRFIEKQTTRLLFQPDPVILRHLAALNREIAGGLRPPPNRHND